VLREEEREGGKMRAYPRSWLRKVLGVLRKVLLVLLPENRFGDTVFSWVSFVFYHGRLPDRNRMWFNDVLYAIKVSDEILDPLRVLTTDKEYVKLFVRAVVGEKYVVPTIKVLRSKEEVNSYQFPPNVVIKPTHMSGRVIFKEGDAPVPISEIQGWFDQNYYRETREANYRFLRPKVIVEPMLFGRKGIEDYKVFCYNGRPRLIQVDIDRFGIHRRKYFDITWREQDFSILYPKAENAFPRPKTLDEMLAVAQGIASYFRGLVRVDFYTDGVERVFVGEITHCHEGAHGPFLPREAERAGSELIFDL
jgi:hypothetical protein